MEWRIAMFNRLSENLLYADTFARNAILNSDGNAGTSALVLNMWMWATHLLWQGVQTCHKKSEADNPAQFNLGTAGFDEFIALWIGTGSNPGSSSGNSLYALAEDAYHKFGGELDEAPANTKIKSLYQEASSQLSIPGVCTSEHTESSRIIWSLATQIISTSMLPILQQLVVAIIDKDASLTKLLATAVVPQSAQCRPSAHKRLNTFLLASANPRFDKTKIILRDLQDVYSCFGLTCDDVGTPTETKGVDVPRCFAATPRAPLAQYFPSTDVATIARLDLDVLQLRILTSAGRFDLAKMWYSYGRNSPVQQQNENDPFSYYSLADLAVASSRRTADPWYSDFVRYFNNNNYADKIVREALDGTSKWRSVAQRSAVVTETSAFMILYLHLISQLNDAVRHCDGKSSEAEYDLTHPWDEVVALIVGSLEGTAEGGSSDGEDGQLLWALNSRRAFQFQTLNDEGYSKINSRMEDLLYAGKGEIDALGCTALENTVDQIQKLSLVPIMQSVLRYAVQNQQLSSTSESADLALGESYALALLPIMDSMDPAISRVIQENMVFENGVQPTRDGAQAVADAVGNFAVAMGLRCQVLGSTPQAKPCRQHGGSGALRLPLVLTSAATAISSIVFLLQ